MRVLQVMAGAAHGGAETFFVALVSALARAGLEQHAVIRTHAERATKLRAATVPVTELRFGGKLDFLTPLALKREVVAFRPDIAVTWMSRASEKLRPGPFVHVARLGGYYDLKHYRHCDHLVCNTEDIAAFCRKNGFPADRVHYLPNFVAWRAAPPVDRATLDTPADAPVLLALGRLHPNKAFDVLLRALPSVPGAYLWLAGEGELQGALERQASELGVRDRVRFLGWRSDKEALFAAANVCVVPSRSEPFGNVVLDAWASGTPLVAAASLGPAAYVAHEVNGLLVPVDDSATLAGAINRLLIDRALAATLAAAGQAKWRDEFSEDVCVRHWLDFLASAVKRKAAA